MIDPYYQSKAVTLYKGDCRAVLREIAPASVALLLTDPPYGISVESDQFADAATDWDNGDPTELIDAMLAEARPKMKPNGAFYVFGHPGQFMNARQQYTRAGFMPLQELVWVKTESGALPNQSRVNKQNPEALRTYFPETERILFGEVMATGRTDEKDAERAWHLREEKEHDAKYQNLKGEWQELRDQWEALRRPHFAQPRTKSDVLRYNVVPIAARCGHPCEKPVDLLADLIKTSTRPGDTVLDCFAGSGATGIAAKATGRRANNERRGAGFSVRRAPQGANHAASATVLLRDAERRRLDAIQTGRAGLRRRARRSGVGREERNAAPVAGRVGPLTNHKQERTTNANNHKHRRGE